MRCAVCSTYDAVRGGRCGECLGGRAPTSAERADAEFEQWIDWPLADASDAERRLSAQRLASKGLSYREVARRLGVGDQTAKRWAVYPTPKPRPRRDPERAAEARRLRAQGWSYRKIARQIGVSHPTARKLANGAGDDAHQRGSDHSARGGGPARAEGERAQLASARAGAAEGDALGA